MSDEELGKIEDWPQLEAKTIADYRIFRVRQDRLRSPRTRGEYDFYVLEMPDWVNVVALTGQAPDERVVLIRQFRFGTRTVALEVPGGVIDPGESPAEAARRELREETGYEATRWTALGAIEPNPAIANNRCHTFLAEGCWRAGEPEQEEREDIAVEERPLADIDGLLARGEISHALVAVAFQRLALARAGVL